MSITITEALAELKIIKSKIDKKKSYILGNMSRQEGAKDLLEKEGGTRKVLDSEIQAVNDLQERMVKIRSAIFRANASSKVTICSVERTIADWLVWRRDVAPIVKNFETMILSQMQHVKNEAKKMNFQVVPHGDAPKNPTDVIFEVDEHALHKQSERTQEILDTLDGKLSLHNATVQVEV